MWPFKKKPQHNAGRDNTWTGGKVHLVLPPLPPEDVGACGARFYTNEFQKHSGTETCLCIFEEPQWARHYGNIGAIDLIVTSMALRTDRGPIAIALWHLLDKGKSLCRYEHYLDPLSERTLQSLNKTGQQKRMKLVMRENQTGETTGFWEFENNFQLSGFATSLSGITGANEAGSFRDRVADAKREYSMEQLIALTQS